MSCFETTDAAARALFGAAPAWRFFVPGRLEVFGKHTDYAGGRSLVSAVPRGFTVSALPSDDGCLIVVDAVSGNRLVCLAADPGAPTARWHRYVLAVVTRLAMNFPGADLATRIVFASDLPSAAGISSSSALVIAVAETLIARAGLEASPAWQATIRSVEDRATYFGCIENGSSFGPLAGDSGVGTHGGSEDHAAMLASDDGRLQLFAFVPLRLERRIAMPAGWTFAVLSSGVRASKTGSAREVYNSLAAEIAEILRIWRERHPGDPRSLGAISQAGDLGAIRLPDRLAARLEHFIVEDARVADAADAFARGDVERIGDLADASHRDAARLLRNQVPETVDLAQMARDLGAPAASAFGAGWGGSVWALTPVRDAETFLDRWRRAFRARYPRHRAEGFVAPPSSGVIRL